MDRTVPDSLDVGNTGTDGPTGEPALARLELGPAAGSVAPAYAAGDPVTAGLSHLWNQLSHLLSRLPS